MYSLRGHQLEACLERVVNHVRHLRQLDLSVEAELEQALAESRQVLGAIAQYRGLLKKAAPHEGIQQRIAA